MKLINADAVKSFVNGYLDGYLHGSDGKEDHLSVGEAAGVIKALNAVDKRIEEEPEVLLEDEKKGYWVTPETATDFPRCSRCGGGAWYYDYSEDIWHSKYCPNCGARMDAEVNNG